MLPNAQKGGNAAASNNLSSQQLASEQVDLDKLTQSNLRLKVTVLQKRLADTLARFRDQAQPVQPLQKKIENLI
jgi:hypothetical protein